MPADSTVEAPASSSEPKDHPADAQTIHHSHKIDGMNAVGIIFGNVGTTEFSFRVFGDIETMEYVQVEHQHEGWVLGRVASMERKTDLSLERAKKLEDGEDVSIDEIVIAKVDVIGFRDDRGLLQVPRTPFRAGDHVYKGMGNLIKDVIGLKENTDTGAYLGLLFGHDIRVEVDINSMVQKHVSILAKTGGGKSFLCGDLIEEMMKRDVTILVFDPHGEYGAMREKGPSTKSQRNFGITTRGYADHIQEYATDTTINPKAKPLKFTLANLDARELLSLTSIKNGKAFLTSLRKAIEAVRAAKKDYCLKDLINVLEADEEGDNASLINELDYLNEVNLFATQGTKIDDLIVKGKMTIINFKGTPPDIQELIVNRIATAAFELRKVGKIPPMMMVTEEAHNYCPQQGLAASSKIFRTIASEGRKFGLGLTIISQRAAKIDKNVLSQCNTQMILKVTNPNDLKAIAASLEGLSTGMEDEIQRLPIGVAL
ncbi:MAG: ATP-binding protein, partial [Methanomassiliicoccales archaeon]|nr:ATP-binding protein [Methanomassiliicoccales archaeon]